MKIIHVNFSGIKGGAAIACQRINLALRNRGIDSEVWCAREADESNGQKCIKKWFWQRVDGVKNKIVQAVRRILDVSDGSLRSFGLFPSNLVRQLNRSDADIVHLHWVAGEMVSIEQLSKIKKPVVWTLHDMWGFCGAEHYSAGDRYISGYKRDDVRSNFANVFVDCGKWNDVDRWVFKRKQRAWKNWSPHIITPSNWLADCARKSALMRNYKINVIPNCLDLDVFKPINKFDARKEFGISEDKKVILFGAFSVANLGKGGDLLAEALNLLENKEQYQLVVFGGASFDFDGEFSVISAGSISDQSKLARLYNFADVMCVPSRMDNLPNTAVEATACGVPVVAFDIGGLPDIVCHKRTGYLANPFDCSDFAHGIEWVFEQLESSDIDLKQNARKRATEIFSEKVVSAQYIKVYEDILTTDEH